MHTMRIVSTRSSMSEDIQLDSSSWEDMEAPRKSLAFSNGFDLMFARQGYKNVSPFYEPQRWLLLQQNLNITLKGKYCAETLVLSLE